MFRVKRSKVCLTEEVDYHANGSDYQQIQLCRCFQRAVQSVFIPKDPLLVPGDLLQLKRLVAILTSLARNIPKVWSEMHVKRPLKSSSAGKTIHLIVFLCF